MEFVSYDIVSNDFRRAGAASRSIKEHLKRIGADAEAIRRTMIAAYEAEMNVVIHSVGGRLEACLSDSQIDVNVVDEGPGIPDVAQAMVEGFSTASAEARALGFGAGMGLPNIKRNSDRLRVTSRMDEGTRVSFTVYLKPEDVLAGGLWPVASLYASADRCRDCRACLTACPTQAMRVREGRPAVLEHLCVECTGCIGACATEALGIREEITSLDDLENKQEMLLAVPPALLAGCGAQYGPAQVRAALCSLGFAGVITSAPFERALLEAAAGAAAPAGATAPAQTGAAPAPTGPVIVPSCPAVVNLIELRFPSLVPHLAPFDSPWEAVQAACGENAVAYVVSCPSQRSALLTHAEADSRAEYLAPEVVREAVLAKLSGSVTADMAAGAAPAGVVPCVSAGARSGTAPGVSAGAAAGRAAKVSPAAPSTAAAGSPPDAGRPGAGPGEPLTVTGVRHVMAVLEDLENGLLDDVAVVDPYACEGGCFGSPLLAEDYHIAARRWSRGGADAEVEDGDAGTALAGTAVATAAVAATAVARRRPFTARPGIRLDPDMGRAIEKLAKLQAVLHSLPGRDCGACGAPTCASLGEDIVMERATVALCPYAATGSTDKEA
jgi:anti-sigma regulatory factor (Ser/Thr protein kinase)/Fe-S-cluster-containing hydrogenase component 2